MRQDPSQRGGAGPGSFLRALDLRVFVKLYPVNGNPLKLSYVKFHSGGGVCLFAGYL